jgi:DNA helicase-2/ATP-dependent DNA helicase PcrA
MEYTSNQKKAIETLDGNLQIIACAGSGKTQVISQRIVNILRDKADEGVGPGNIVAFTFTDKAAGELKDRIHGLCREQLGGTQGLAEMFVGTIHGFCLDLLQSYQYRFLKYRVLNDVQQRLLIDRHCKQAGLKDLVTRDGKELKRWQDSRLYQRCLSVIRESQVDEEALCDHPIRNALVKYNELLDRKKYLDYSRILTEAVTALATDAELRAKIASRLRYLIVDEYQDVNPLQEALIRVLHELGAQVCVVGDDDQTIYQWNGSDINNIRSFADRYSPVTTVPMGDNFRSSKGVVESARQVVERNSARLLKKMESLERQPFEYGDLLCLRFDDPQAEARWAVEKVLAMRGRPFSENGQTRGLTWSDCAILLRSVKTSAPPIIAALREAGIPYVVKGVSGLLDTAEAQAAMSIYRYLHGEMSREALASAWASADLGLSDVRIEKAIDWLDAEKADWDNRWINRTYSLQHTFRGFLEALELREEGIPGHGVHNRRRGEIVYYNLGKFSQVISDFEEIHWQSQPASFYQAFAGFLTYQAGDYYPEGWEDVAFITPDAVQVMTVHQAKGMEFPVVFIPNLVSNRFPTPAARGRQWWHIIPEEAIAGAPRYHGSIEDERRLLYVALTRSKKYLYCTWAPEASKGHFSKASPFVTELTASAHVLTREPTPSPVSAIEPRAARSEIEIPLTFSEVKYYFECPYQFKLRYLYGFQPGFHEKLGYGKSLHDCLAEVHRRALDGEYLSPDDAPRLLDTHLHLPYAWPALVDSMRASADGALRKYLTENGPILDKIEYAEKTVELKLSEGVVVHGRIDLIRRTDTQQVIIVDFKSTDRAQEEDLTRMQLHIYAMGYQQLAGQSADLVEIYNLDEGAGATVRELVDDRLLRETENAVVSAGCAIRDSQLPRLPKCSGCDFRAICRTELTGA